MRPAANKCWLVKKESSHCNPDRTGGRPFNLNMKYFDDSFAKFGNYQKELYLKIYITFAPFIHPGKLVAQSDLHDVRTLL